MEREIIELRAQLAGMSQQPSPVASAPLIRTPKDMATQNVFPVNQDMDSGEAVASLMDLAHGAEAGSFMKSPNAQLLFSKRLGDIALSQDQVQDLFEMYAVLTFSPSRIVFTVQKSNRRAYRYFTFYHPFMPLLDPGMTPEEYYELCRLLFWAIICVASRRYATDRQGADQSLFTSLSTSVYQLVWKTIEEIPQTCNAIKALCVLCTWTFPVNSTSLDPTLVLSSLMMSLAMQQGLHRPSHVQDFSKYRTDLREDQLRDRVRTWAACNAIAQRSVHSMVLRSPY